MASYVLEELSRCVCSLKDYTILGIKLRVPTSTQDRIRFDNQSSILVAALKMVEQFYQGTGGTKEQKMDIFHRVLREMKPGVCTPFVNQSCLLRKLFHEVVALVSRFSLLKAGPSLLRLFIYCTVCTLGDGCYCIYIFEVHFRLVPCAQSVIFR